MLYVFFSIPFHAIVSMSCYDFFQVHVRWSSSGTSFVKKSRCQVPSWLGGSAQPTTSRHIPKPTFSKQSMASSALTPGHCVSTNSNRSPTTDLAGQHVFGCWIPWMSQQTNWSRGSPPNTCLFAAFLSSFIKDFLLDKYFTRNATPTLIGMDHFTNGTFTGRLQLDF